MASIGDVTFFFVNLSKKLKSFNIIAVMTSNQQPTTTNFRVLILAFMIQKTLNESAVMKFNMNFVLVFMIQKTVNELAVIENSVNQAMALWACLCFGPLS